MHVDSSHSNQILMSGYQSRVQTRDSSEPILPGRDTQAYVSYSICLHSIAVLNPSRSSKLSATWVVQVRYHSEPEVRKFTKKSKYGKQMI